MLTAALDALRMAAAMGWLVLWPLILGFGISAVIQAVVSQSEVARLLPDDGPASIARASALGAASSSCSYAAVAIARSLVRKNANFSAAMAFQFASTNLVVELGLVLWVLMGWRFTAAAWAGGVIMIIVLTALLRVFFTGRLAAAAKAQAEKGVAGRMEGHAAMDMAVTEGPLLRRLVSPKALTAISHYFYMDVTSLWLDLLIGLLVAGALAAWVPGGVWSSVFLSAHPAAARIIGPLVGPLVAVMSFVCSVGNVPLAAVLWSGGASFGGVVAFIFGDLIILPILDIYRRYYGLKAAIALGLIFYAAMAAAGYGVELAFGVLGLAPTRRSFAMIAQGFAWDATTWLNLALLAVAALLLWRFLTTGGPAMLRHMEHGHDHADHHHHH
jgi:uncharacterized protein